jgi:hypothetical protein
VCIEDIEQITNLLSLDLHGFATSIKETYSSAPLCTSVYAKETFESTALMKECYLCLLLRRLLTFWTP